MDPVIEIEICLQYLNDLFAKSVAFAAEREMQKLDAIRHQIYYGKFDFTLAMQALNTISKELTPHA